MYTGGLQANAGQGLQANAGQGKATTMGASRIDIAGICTPPVVAMGATYGTPLSMPDYEAFSIDAHSSLCNAFAADGHLQNPPRGGRGD